MSRDITVSSILAKRICAMFDVDEDRCAGVTVELFPMDPIKISFKMLGGEDVDAIDWDWYLDKAKVVKTE